MKNSAASLFMFDFHSGMDRLLHSVESLISGCLSWP